MEPEAIIGCVIVLGALVLNASLVLWSRRAIHRIARRGYGSARQIAKELNGGREAARSR